MKKLLVLFLILFSLPVLAKNTLLIIGDSIGASYGVEAGKGWVSLLGERLENQGLEYNIVNASISGDTTTNGLARLPKELETNKPQITIIELGGNDGLRGVSSSKVQENLSQMIDLAKAAGSKVVLLGIRLPSNFGEAYIAKFHDVYTTLGEDKGISVVPFFLQNIDDKPDLMQEDHIHPNANAQSILLDNLWPVLQPLLKP